MLDKARAVTAKVQALQREASAARRVAHEAQVQEALVRSGLALSLNAVLASRSALEAQLRARALALFAARGARPLRRHGRPSRWLDRLLGKLGPIGQALIIARSGIWRSSGRPLADLSVIARYAARGANPLAAPAAPFDQPWYVAAYPDVASGGVPPLVHYLLAGAREGRAPGPLFHPAMYAAENAHDLAASGLSPLEHYVRKGAVSGRRPHPLFDPAYYLAQAPALEPGDDPLSHYLREGWREGLSPHPLFAPDWYARQQGAAKGEPGLAHYLTRGWRDGLSPHPLFDPVWYLEQNPSVAAAGVEPLTHFLLSGAAEGCSPSPWFDLPDYIVARGEALQEGRNPLVDYLEGGAWTVAEPKAGVPTVAYLASRPQMDPVGITPLEDWARRQGR